MSDMPRDEAAENCTKDAAQLRAQLEQARADQRRAQALLEATASLMGLSDTRDLFDGLAENVVRHIGFERASVYEADHDTGLLREVARAEREGDADAMPLPGMERVRMADPDSEPIPLRPGSTIAEFALADRSHLLLPMDGSPLDGHGCLLVQMRATSRSGLSRRTALMGIIVAFSRQQTTRRQADLLRSLAALGSVAAEATRVESFRTRLVSAVSHELRTPLAAIRAYNEMLLDEDAGEINDEQRLFLERIETTCINLDRLVDDLLDLSQLRAGQLNLRREPVDVIATIEHILDTLQSEAGRREISLAEEIVGELPLISSDADRLAQVLFNLVGNAVKYVQEGGEVLVRAALVDRAERDRLIPGAGCGEAGGSDSKCLLIEVIDDGPGIGPDDIEHIFDEFYRGDQTDGVTRGSGLGLAIASRLTRMLGGLLDVQSTVGEGSTFYLLFPVDSTDRCEATGESGDRPDRQRGPD